MSAIAIVSAEVDQELKDQATAIYAAAGLTISKAFRMLLVQTVAERALPFHSFRPNAETINAKAEDVTGLRWIAICSRR